MKRDMDLIREILLAVEELDTPTETEALSLPGRSAQDVLHHAVLLVEAGLIKAEIGRYVGGGMDCLVERLTWAGHEFLDAARDETVWRKVRGKAGQVGGTVTLDLLMALLKAAVAERLGVSL